MEGEAVAAARARFLRAGLPLSGLFYHYQGSFTTIRALLPLSGLFGGALFGAPVVQNRRGVLPQVVIDEPE